MLEKPSNPALIVYLMIALYIPLQSYAKTDPMVQNRNDKSPEDVSVGHKNSEMPSEQSNDGWLELVSLQVLILNNIKKQSFYSWYITAASLYITIGW